MPSQKCPCGSKDYASCCQPLHLGQIRAQTAEQLMRSRFSAFAKGLGQYLMDTHHPEFQQGLSAALLSDNDGITWLNLRIIAANRDVQSKLNNACVEFKASFKQDEQVQVMHERSYFQRWQGQWVYTHGEQNPSSIGRNHACPCESGKKYKQCCGR